MGTFIADLNFQNTCRSVEDVFECGNVVIVEVTVDAKPRAQGGCKQAHPCGGAYECKGVQVDLYASRIGARVDHDVDAVIFHGGVQVFFHDGIEAVDFIDEQHIAGIQVGKQTGEVAWFFEDGPGGHAQGTVEFLGDDVGKGCFSQAGRTVQQHMIERIATLFGGLNEDLKVVYNFLLTAEFIQQFGTKCFFEQFVIPCGFVGEFFADDGVFLWIARAKLTYFVLKAKMFF